ncbi:MAG: YeeE/YedE family protein [Flavobacteriales bacterium]|nr:YeeE/YedE family protein [Flavobacteriales bacterium]
METILEYITKPWPWWISGPLLGLVVPVLLLFKHKFGVSSIFRHLCTATGLAKSDYFQYSLKEHSWQILFVGGVLLSGLIYLVVDMETGELNASAVAYFNARQLTPEGLFPTERFQAIPFSATGLLSVGGFLIGFGSRYANGCTSGHAITGLSLLSPGSLIAVIGFFIGGVAGTFLILDQVL